MGNCIFLFLLFLCILFFYLANKKENKLLLIIGVLILSIVSGFRGYDVGIDTKLYYGAFINDFPKAWQFEEKGFRLITNFLTNRIEHVTLVFFIYACITNFFIFFRLWDFKKKCNFVIMSILYILIFFISSMNIMRQFIAISIIFFSTRFLEKKNYITFIIIVLLCTFIHKSSALALIIMVIYYWKLLSKRNKILLIVPIIVTFIIGVKSLINYGSSDIENYLSNSNSISNFNITFLYRFLIFILSYFLNNSGIRVYISSKSNKKIHKKGDSIKENINEFKIISIIYLIGLILGSLGMFYEYAGRIGCYCLIFELVYWGYLTYNNKNKFLNIWMIMFYAIYVFSLEIIYNGSHIFPYYMNYI